MTACSSPGQCFDTVAGRTPISAAIFRIIVLGFASMAAIET